MVVNVHMRDGTTHGMVRIDGGGMALVGPDRGRREVHGTFPGGGFFCEFEDDVAHYVDPDTGRQVDPLVE